MTRRSLGRSLYRKLDRWSRHQGWHGKEPSPRETGESPTSLRRLVLRALAGGMTTSGKPTWLHPGSSSEDSGALAGRRSLRDLAGRPVEERHRAIRAASFAVKTDEVEVWDGTAGDNLER